MLPSENFGMRPIIRSRRVSIWQSPFFMVVSFLSDFGFFRVLLSDEDQYGPKKTIARTNPSPARCRVTHSLKMMGCRLLCVFYEFGSVESVRSSLKIEISSGFVWPGVGR